VEGATPVDGYDVAVCRTCGFGFADGIPSQVVFDRYYRDLSKYENHHRGGAESPHDRRRFALIADLVCGHLASRAVRILDVGCATGGLLADIRSRGFAAVTGLDPSPGCAEAARRLYDLDVLTMPLADLARAGGRFDVALMIGVLEHLRDLAPALRDLRSILDGDGLLYIEVPDVTAFADWPNAPYQDFSTEHINFFSPSSLDNLMTRNGFSRVFLERNHREQSHRTVMSNVSAMYRRDGVADRGATTVDHETREGLERYIKSCRAEDERVRKAIDAVLEARRQILVWGVGTHTSRLMATSRLADARIVAFIESNTRYHGRTLLGRPILAPEALKDHEEPVLISSRVFQTEIVNQIRKDLGCSNELLLLYHD